MYPAGSPLAAVSEKGSESGEYATLIVFVLLILASVSALDWASASCMADAIGVLNAGSSSLKFSLFAQEAGRPGLVARGQAEGLYTSPRFVAKNSAGEVLDEKTWPAGAPLGHDGALEYLMGFVRGRLAQHRLIGVGHRVVHGGREFVKPVRVDENIAAALEKYVPLAPLHQPHNLAPIKALLARSPELPQIACFDTSFHRTQPTVAQAFALPASITDRGVLRYGFHGRARSPTCATRSTR